LIFEIIIISKLKKKDLEKILQFDDGFNSCKIFIIEVIVRVSFESYLLNDFKVDISSFLIFMKSFLIFKIFRKFSIIFSKEDKKRRLSMSKRKHEEEKESSKKKKGIFIFFYF